MSVYQGGKKRIGKRIHKVISELEEELTMGKNCDYFEPFCGMCSVLRHFCKEKTEKKLKRDIMACDVNQDLLLLLKAVQKRWKPPKKCSKKKWEKLKESSIHSAERGFLGIAGSWGGIFFQGYRLGYTKKRNYLQEASEGLEKLAQDMKGSNVKFLKSSSYDKFNPENLLIYCDPPYKGNQLGQSKTAFFQDFDHEQFWEIIREWSRKNIVIVSESTAPRDFKKIWSIESFVNNSDRYKTKKYPDNLYVHEKTYSLLSKTFRKRLREI